MTPHRQTPEERDAAEAAAASAFLDDRSIASSAPQVLSAAKPSENPCNGEGAALERELAAGVRTCTRSIAETLDEQLANRAQRFTPDGVCAHWLQSFHRAGRTSKRVCCHCGHVLQIMGMPR